MILPPAARRLALTAHVTTSVGWLGAVIGFLALAVVGASSHDEQTARSAYIAMDSTAWFVLVPLALASLLTGLVQSLGSKWGLFRHYWVLFKLAITVVATAILLLYTETLNQMAELARDPASTSAELEDHSPVLHATAALVILIAATALAVFKPRGVTPYGWRKLRGRTF